MRLPCVLFALAATGCSAAAAPDHGALDLRIRQLEDDRAVHELLVRYGEVLDARDHAGYAALFATHGTSVTGYGWAIGPARIEALLERSLGRPEPGWVNDQRFHLMTTSVIEIDGDRASARSRYTVFAATPDARPEPALSGRYIDDLVRENGAWKLEGRISHGVIPYRDPIEDAPQGRSGAS